MFLTADKAINGNHDIHNFANTKKGIGQWWQANFEDEVFNVVEVRIMNRRDGNGERLGKCKIEIDGVYFGSLPAITEVGKWYSIKPEKEEYITGTSVKVI